MTLVVTNLGRGPALYCAAAGHLFMDVHLFWAAEGFDLAPGAAMQFVADFEPDAASQRRRRLTDNLGIDRQVVAVAYQDVFERKYRMTVVDGRLATQRFTASDQPPEWTLWE